MSSSSSALICFHCLRYSLSSSSLRAIFLMYPWILVPSSWTVVLKLTSPRPPSFHLVYSIRVLNLEWNPPCIVRSFLVLIPVALLWPASNTSRAPDDWQGICIDGSDLVLPIQLTFQDLLNSVGIGLWLTS